MINEKEKEGDAQVGSMQLLNTLKAKSVPKMPKNKGLMYIETHVNGKLTKAIVDMGATHNFASVDDAKRLELHASKEGGWLKAINYVVKPLQSVSCEVTIHIDT